MAQRKRILIVDDEPQNQRLIKDFLEVLGHTSEPANGGLEALEKLNSGFDLVLLDVMMPGMDGFEVVRHIRENPAFADTELGANFGLDRISIYSIIARWTGATGSHSGPLNAVVIKNLYHSKRIKEFSRVLSCRHEESCKKYDRQSAYLRFLGHQRRSMR